ncbi:MAG: thioredoxin domain-containing protein [Proteobacteria bacterium]|nr:thioredoxin domain-containing protein [Pseudomonadota bacterium]
MKVIPYLLFVATLLPGIQAFAQTPTCDALQGDAKTTAQKVISTAYPYDCCDDTIEKCLKAAAPCKLATRLADEACRLADKGKSADEIRHLLDQRALVMSPLTPPAKIALAPEHVWGNPGAKVVLTVYLCGRCPYCSRHVPQLIHALEKSPLKDKIAVNLRLFPIKSHENSSLAAFAVEAAAKLGHAWPYLIESYEHFDEFSPEKITEWAAKTGADPKQFDELMKDAAIRAAVVDAKKEGLTNGVESTPTFFLNGQKIQSAFDVESLISMLEEAAEK